MVRPTAVVELSDDWLNCFTRNRGLGSAPILCIVFNKIDKMDSKIGFETSLIVVEGIRGRCASFMILTATVSEIIGGQTNSSVLVV